MSTDRPDPKNSPSDVCKPSGLPIQAMRAPQLSERRLPSQIQKVTPQSLRAAMRRRGATGVGIFGLSSLLALVLSTQLELSLGWAVLTYVIFQTAPILVFERSFVHRCPACDTPLESMLEEAESDTPAAIRTHCPTCDVDA